MDHFLICSSGRRLRLSVPLIDESELPVVESADELNDMSDPPKIKMELILDDGGDAWPMVEEQLEGVAFLAARELIPEALADELNNVILGMLN